MLQTFKILAAERLRLIKFCTRLIADYFQHVVNVKYETISESLRNQMYFQVYLLQQKHKHLQLEVVLQKHLHVDGFHRQAQHILIILPSKSSE